MATYVMADIHGYYERYLKMLKLINFGADDKLIINGDFGDRGPDGVKLILDIMSRDNVELVVGNHDLMLVESVLCKGYGPNGRWSWKNTWLNNGGGTTYSEFIKLPAEKQKEIVDYIQSSPYFKTVEAGGKKFYIVHGGPYGSDRENDFEDFEHNVVWNRPFPYRNKVVEGMDYVVVGHTCTARFHGCEGEHFTIFKNNWLIGIDCGCGKNLPQSRLACLRLDDMEEFYV